MQLRPPTEPIGDPFFDEVRRRHPEVDVIVLPSAPPPTGDVVDDALVAETRDRVERAGTDVWALTGSTATPDTRLRYADDGAVRATFSVHDEVGSQALPALTAGLEERGWQVTPRTQGLAGLTARRDDLRLTSTYAVETHLLRLDLSSGSLPVGPERARELTRRPTGDGGAHG